MPMPVGGPPPMAPPPAPPTGGPPAAAPPPQPAEDDEDDEDLPPPPPADTIICRATAVYDYNATQADELTFKENEIIDIIKKNDDGWFEGVIGDRHGL